MTERFALLVSELEACVPAFDALGPSEIDRWLDERQVLLDALGSVDPADLVPDERQAITARLMAVLERDRVLVDCLVRARSELEVQVDQVNRARGAVRGYRFLAAEQLVSRRSA